MTLDGIHHVTCITGDAPRNVDFYTRVLGLRMVKKTVNQDDPTVYHLFYADEAGTPGSDITFFEYPGVRRGSAGAGMVHTVQWRVGSEAALDFWESRLAGEAGASRDADERDVRGSGGPAASARRVDGRRRTAHRGASRGSGRACAAGLRRRARVRRARRRAAGCSRRRSDSSPSADDTWEARGPTRGGLYAYDEPPAERGLGGAGTVHHVAWATQVDEQDAWHARVAAAGMHPSPIIDRFWFRSIYFREPSGVLFELATLGPGFSVDEDPEHLGESLILPPAFEHLRSQVEPALTPIPDPRPWLVRRSESASADSDRENP